MAILRKASEQRAAQVTQHKGVTDAQYLEYLTPLTAGDVAEVELEDGDDPRMVKRSITRAAKQLNKPIRWHEQTGPILVFQVLTDEQGQKRDLRRARKGESNDAATPASEAPSV